MFSNFSYISASYTTKKTSQNTIPSTVAFCKQVHSSRVFYASSLGLAGEGDGVWTDKRGIFCSVHTADCLPLAFVYDDRAHPSVAILHGGWRGLRDGIINSLLEQWKIFYPFFDPTKVYVHIGPGIGVCCYEFGQEALELFPFSVVVLKEQKLFVDLKKYALLLCEQQGIPLSNIEIVDACTKCQDDVFWSYRRGDTSGRIVSWIGLV